MTEQRKTLLRISRFVRGLCPIHERAMQPVHSDCVRSRYLTLFTCPNADCVVTALRLSYGTFDLSQEMATVIVGE